ncbi:MAG: ABC transporter substrate-binding protein [Candidatus Heimdallarchaeota archaeon]
MKITKTNLRKMILPLLLIIGLAVIPMIGKSAQALKQGPFFSISLLAPNSNPARNQWATIMVEQLPKIGIEVDIFDHTSWSQIYPRTFDYPGPYPIPSYAEGGYDILFVGYGWGLDLDPTGLFDTAGITPVGDNFYQYSNQAMDDAIGNYTQAFVTADRMEYAKEIQAILYEDNPSIAILYSTSLFPHDEDLTGWDPLMWASNYEPMENWAIAGETDLHYACPADFTDFLPQLYESTYDGQWLRQIFNGLVDRDATADNAYMPRLAESVSTTDGITYEIILKDNLFWADGVPFTTDDVIYNYNLAVDPLLGHSGLSFNELYWDNESITKVSDTEFTFEFLQPYVFQDSNLALDLIPEHIWGPIAPEDHATQSVTWASSNPEKFVGMGPYKLNDYDPTNQVIHLEVNEYFDDWSGITPELTDVFFEFYTNKEGALSALAAGLVDMCDSQYMVQIDELDGIAGIEYTLTDDPGNQEMSVNMEHPYLGTGESCPVSGAASSNAIRKAISHMIPREVIVEEILNGLGYPATTHWPRVSVGYDFDLEPYKYDLVTALEYMELAGFDVVFPTEVTLDGGFGLITILGILSLAGAVQFFFLRRKK